MAEYIKVPAGVYDMVTRCMEQEFPDHVAIRYVAEDGKTVVEKKYREMRRTSAGWWPISRPKCRTSRASASFC